MADYGTVAAFRTYHTARNRDVSSYLDAAVESAKLIASEWIDARYRMSFDGRKVGMRDQVREWPRVGALDANGYVIAAALVPTEVENATYEATLKQLITVGSLSQDWTPTKYKRASVDGAVSVDFTSFSTVREVQTRFAVIDEILSPILTGRGDDAPFSGPAYRA